MNDLSDKYTRQVFMCYNIIAIMEKENEELTFKSILKRVKCPRLAAQVRSIYVNFVSETN